MNYEYIRVSTTGQKIDRQMDAMHQVGIDDEFIYTDKESGKDINRKN